VPLFAAWRGRAGASNLVSGGASLPAGLAGVETTIMSYIDPDQLHGAVDDLIAHVTSSAAALTAGGTDPTVISAKLTAIRDDVQSKKSVRDAKKADLAVAQQAYAASAAKNYTDFSSTVDAIAGALGKMTPAGKQALGYRSRLNATSQHHAAAAPAAPPA
jgi:hypothetical protein